MTNRLALTAIDVQLQELQAGRLINAHTLLSQLVVSTTGEAQRLARAALADLEAYGQALNREARGK